MSKIDLLNSIPLHGERIFSCNDMNVEKLSEFNSLAIKLIYELQSDGKLEIVGDPRRENSTGYSFISLIRVRRIN